MDPSWWWADLMQLSQREFGTVSNSQVFKKSFEQGHWGSVSRCSGNSPVKKIRWNLHMCESDCSDNYIADPLKIWWKSIMLIHGQQLVDWTTLMNREGLFLVSSLNPSHSRHSMLDLSIEEADTDVVLCFDLSWTTRHLLTSRTMINILEIAIIQMEGT